jgi:hypothetical protein
VIRGSKPPRRLAPIGREEVRDPEVQTNWVYMLCYYHSTGRVLGDAPVQQVTRHRSIPISHSEF